MKAGYQIEIGAYPSKLVAYDDVHTTHNYIIKRERKDRQRQKKQYTYILVKMKAAYSSGDAVITNILS